MSVIPNIIKAYCKKCGHTDHSVLEVKKRKMRSMCLIERRRERRGNRGNLGKFSEPVPSRCNVSKHPHLILRCSKCNLGRNLTRPRARKFKVEKIKINSSI